MLSLILAATLTMVGPDSAAVMVPDTVWVSGAAPTHYHKHYHVPGGVWVFRKDADAYGLTPCRFCFRPVKVKVKGANLRDKLVHLREERKAGDS